MTKPTSYVTHQKLVLSEVIEAANRPLTAHDIWEEAQKRLPNLGIATVYRALRQFKEEGLVKSVDLPGVTPHYESVTHQHHHFFLCNQCNRVYNLEGCLHGIDSLAPKSFQIERHEIVLYGNCRDCIEAG